MVEQVYLRKTSKENSQEGKDQSCNISQKDIRHVISLSEHTRNVVETYTMSNAYLFMKFTWIRKRVSGLRRRGKKMTRFNITFIL